MTKTNILKKNALVLKGCSAVATATLKTVNQDFGLTIDSPGNQVSGVVVADGLGSFYKAEVASQVVCESIQDQIFRIKRHLLTFDDLFKRAENDLVKKIDQQKDWLKEMPDKNQAFGTTLICALDLEDVIKIGYLGNGAAFHIRGNFNDFPKSILLPWNSLNYLNPHTISSGGKEAIYKLLSYQNLQFTPSSLSLSKDIDTYGDIVMICTDGVYSSDQLAVGKSSDGKHWISGEESMSLFYQHLNHFFDKEDWSSTQLTIILNEYLEALQYHKLMEDDCTIGLIITERALQYQLLRKTKKQHAQN